MGVMGGGELVQRAGAQSVCGGERTAFFLERRDCYRWASELPLLLGEGRRMDRQLAPLSCFCSWERGERWTGSWLPSTAGGAFPRERQRFALIADPQQVVEFRMPRR